MEQEELMQFVQWLPSKVEEFQNKTPEEIVGKLNELAQTEDGMNTISGLINQFKQEQSAGMFKQGGKLAYLVNKFKNGGSAKNERKENKKVVKEGKKSSKFNRTAYRNMKSAIKDQDLGLSRREVKAAAMKNIVGDNSNLGNPNRFDSRYIGPRSMSVNYGNNATLGSIPIEHRINPRNLGSFFQEGGKTSQRKSDKARKEFHGVDLFEYGPNKWVHNGAQVARSLKPGVNQTVLPNGVGLRQITRNNITTSELVSPNKQDTLYIHNGIGGRVDSNIDDSGILGFLGLRRSSPVSNRYKELQSKFGAQKFAEGKIIPKIKRDTVVNNVGNLTDRGVIDREMIIAGTIPGTNNQLIDSIRRHVIAPTFENPYLGTQTMPGDTLYYRTSGVYTPSGNALQRVQDNNYKPTKEEKEKLNKK